MYALDAQTGVVKWAFASGGWVDGGPSVVDGVVYWGSGYKAVGGGAAGVQVILETRTERQGGY
jgi:polyvinyl alcohol dehydrogenase (cytochrome)